MKSVALTSTRTFYSYPSMKTFGCFSSLSAIVALILQFQVSGIEFAVSDREAQSTRAAVTSGAAAISGAAATSGAAILSLNHRFPC